MSSGDRPEGSESGSDRSRYDYASSRKQSRSRIRLGAILLAVLGCLIVAFALVNLYVPETANPVQVSPDPIIGLGSIGGAGGVLVLFALLVYVFASRAGV